MTATPQAEHVHVDQERRELLLWKSLRVVRLACTSNRMMTIAQGEMNNVLKRLCQEAGLDFFAERSTAERHMDVTKWLRLERRDRS